jgi:hypothetical protein
LFGENVTENKQKPEKVRVSLGFLCQKTDPFRVDHDFNHFQVMFKPPSATMGSAEATST